jgi:hypothetical protein
MQDTTSIQCRCRLTSLCNAHHVLEKCNISRGRLAVQIYTYYNYRSSHCTSSYRGGSSTRARPPSRWTTYSVSTSSCLRLGRLFPLPLGPPAPGCSSSAAKVSRLRSLLSPSPSSSPNPSCKAKRRLVACDRIVGVMVACDNNASCDDCLPRVLVPIGDMPSSVDDRLGPE